MGRGLLILTGALIVVIGIVQLSMQERQKAVPVRTAEYHIDQQNTNITGSLINLAIEEIKKDPTWKGSFTFSDYMGGSGQVVAYDQTDGSYPDSINVAQAGGWNEYKVLLYAEATYEGNTTATEVLLEKEAFTKFLYMTDEERNDLWWVTGDTLNGRMHSNDQFQMAGNPVFNGFISSPQTPEYFGGIPTSPEFNGGTDWSAPTSPLPTDLTFLKDAAMASSLRFDNPIKVYFEDGNVRILERVTSWASAVEHNIPKADYDGKVISTKFDVAEVKGTVDGQITLHSEKDIWITGDIRYKNNPRVDSTSTDVLGMVAEKKAWIDEDAHTDNGTEDLYIEGALMALQHEMEVEDFTTGLRGSLHLYGSKITSRSGPTGTFNAAGLVSGYSLNYVYDPRFKQMTSPHFPRENYFSVIYWRDRDPVGFP